MSVSPIAGKGSSNTSLKTVESRRRKLMEKLRVQSVAELVKYAIRKGLTEIDS